MKSSQPTLVVGATGLLGGEIVQQLGAARRPVRALIRRTSSATRIAAAEAAGAQLVVGDLKEPPSLAAACSGVRSIVSTATSIVSRADGDSLEAVDLRGQLTLIDAAERAGVEHFVFISFPPATLDTSFQRSKRAVEARLREGKLSYTIVQAASFAEIWLGPFLGFDPLNGHARVFGDGQRPTSWISFRDVARFTVAALEGGPFSRKTLALGGPEALSYHDILALYAAHGVRDVQVEHVPQAALEAQLRAAADPIQEALAASALARAHEQIVPSLEALALWPGPLTRMRDLVAELVAAHRGR